MAERKEVVPVTPRARAKAEEIVTEWVRTGDDRSQCSAHDWLVAAIAQAIDDETERAARIAETWRNVRPEHDTPWTATEVAVAMQGVANRIVAAIRSEP